MGHFSFVNLSHPNDVQNRAVKAVIRRHVMKDIGRLRRKKPRAIVIPLQMRVYSPDRAPSRCALQVDHPSGDLHLSRSPNPHGIFGVDLDGRALEIVHYMMSQPGSHYRPFHFVWIRMGLSDPTTFYMSLANTLLLWNRMKGQPNIIEYTDSPESMKYYFEALNQLSKRLLDPRERISAGVIATVLGYMCHDISVGNWERWGVHLHGLIHIYKLRGGFDGLENHIPLMAFWLDLVGKAVIDSLPWFPIPLEVFKPRPQETSPELQTLLCDLESTAPQLLPILDALRLMDSIAGKVNQKNDSARFWEDDVGSIHMLGPVTHHLLSAPRLSDEVTDDAYNLIVAELVRLACLMLLSALKKRFSLNASDIIPLRVKFASVAARNMRELDGPLQDLNLWALVTAGLLTSCGNRLGLIPHICSAMRSKGISDGQSAIDFSKSVIWIEALEAHEEIQLARELDSNLFHYTP